MSESFLTPPVVDRVVRASRLPGATARDTVRRELAAHFEDAALHNDDVGEVVAHFGREADVAAAFRSVYRAEYVLWSVMRVMVCVIAATAIGLALMAVTQVRFDADGVAFASGFARRGANLFKLAVGSAIAWELSRKPLTVMRLAGAVVLYALLAGASQLMFWGTLRTWHFWNVPIMIGIGVACSRINQQGLRWVMTFGGFVLTMQVFFLMRDSQWLASSLAGPDRLWLTAFENFVVWMAAIAALPRSGAFVQRYFDQEELS